MKGVFYMKTGICVLFGLIFMVSAILGAGLVLELRKVASKNKKYYILLWILIIVYVIISLALFKLAGI